MAVIYYMIQLYSMLIFIRILMSWISIGPNNPVIETLCQITDPYLNIFRSIIPPAGGLDFSPIIALVVLHAIGRMLVFIS
ncbi:YggT family protein [bacterium]|nr:YggT family protein [bacterium]